MIDFNKDAEQPEKPGGQGGPSSLRADAGQTSDTRLVERAVRERWPIPSEYRKPLIDRQVAIAIDPTSSKREATSAFKAVLSAEAQNQADEHKVMPSVVLVGHRQAKEMTEEELDAIIDGHFAAGGATGEAVESPRAE